GGHTSPPYIMSTTVNGFTEWAPATISNVLTTRNAVAATCLDLKNVDFTLQAESATLSSPGLFGSTRSGYRGTRYVTLQSSGQWLQWTLPGVEYAGPYDLQLRYSNAGPADAVLNVSINGSVVSGIRLPATGSSTQWQMFR